MPLCRVCIEWTVEEKAVDGTCNRCYYDKHVCIRCKQLYYQGDYSEKLHLPMKRNHKCGCGGYLCYSCTICKPCYKKTRTPEKALEDAEIKWKKAQLAYKQSHNS